MGLLEIGCLWIFPRMRKEGAVLRLLASKKISLLFFDDAWLDRTFSDDPQRLSSGDDFLRSFSLADVTGHLAQPKLNLIFNPLWLDQSCAKVFVGVDESYPSIATEPVNRCLVQKREIASERLVLKHAFLSCLRELSACQTNVGCECLLWEQATQETTNWPKTYEHADLRACRTQQNECPKPLHRPAPGFGLCSWKKLWGLTTGMNLSDFPAKFCTKPGMSASLTLTVCTRFSCGLLASVAHGLCNAEMAPMSISVSLSQRERRLGLCLFAAAGQLGFRLLLWPLPFFWPRCLALVVVVMSSVAASSEESALPMVSSLISVSCREDSWRKISVVCKKCQSSKKLGSSPVRGALLAEGPDSSFGEVHRGSCSGNIHMEEEVKHQEDEVEDGRDKWRVRREGRRENRQSHRRMKHGWYDAQRHLTQCRVTDCYTCAQTREKGDVWSVLFTHPVGCSRLPSAVNDLATTN